MAGSTENVPSVPNVEKSQDAQHHETTVEHVEKVNATIARTDSHLDEQHVALGWRSWLVVLVTMWA